jgi:hypothetical protein
MPNYHGKESPSVRACDIPGMYDRHYYRIVVDFKIPKMQ